MGYVGTLLDVGSGKPSVILFAGYDAVKRHNSKGP